MVKSNVVEIRVREYMVKPPEEEKPVEKMPPEWIKYLGLLIPAAVIIWYLYKKSRGEV